MGRTLKKLFASHCLIIASLLYRYNASHRYVCVCVKCYRYTIHVILYYTSIFPYYYTVPALLAPLAGDNPPTPQTLTTYYIFRLDSGCIISWEALTQ